ncbi:MAG: hypothetical protein RLZZ591_2461 [Pseudomonadota bacterium]|jgi:PAS domain S-box-containing protein
MNDDLPFFRPGDITPDGPGLFAAGASEFETTPSEQLPIDGPAVAQMVQELRQYQAELEIQNQALRYSQQAAEGASERFLTLFSNVPLALMVVDENGLVLESNAMALRLFRPDETDPPLNFIMPLVGQQYRAQVTALFGRALAQGTSEASELVFARGLSSSFMGDLHIARIENSQDELAHFICAFIDQGPLLAERQALQHRNEELHQSQNRLAAIINSALDAIICVDGQHRISVFNPAAAALFQCPSDQALGRPLEQFLPDAARSLAYAQVSTHAQLGEMVGLTTGGKVLAVEVSVSCDQRSDGDIITVFARDLTGRKKIEAQRNALEAQLRESHKMQAIGTMAGGIAHDFNNILSAILGNVELARQDAGAASPAQTSLTEIDKAGRRARDLVRQILTFSRNEQARRSAISLEDVVLETTRLLKVTLPPAVELSLQADADLPPVLGDATQVEQTVLNLCTNAIQAIGSARGQVHIELGRLGHEQLPASGRDLPPGTYVSLAVRDTGAGIAAETLQRIFEPFFTTKPVGQGTGLGLSVVHGIMRTHQGAIDVQSTPGEGSVFTLYFPAAPTAALAPPPALVAAPVPSAAPAGSAGHVMYVDDDQALVFLVERVLRRRGFKVSTYTDPHEAERALRERAHEFDLLVTDYNMPGYCGVDLLRAARLIRADLPVALASGYVTPEIEQSAYAEGARALIHKPNDVDELCATVERLVQEGSGR